MIVVFAGAGASYAVNDQYYPMTRQFLESLGPDITHQRLYSHLLSFVKQKYNTQTPDIEMLLWEVSAMLSSAKAATDTDQPLGAMIQPQIVREVTGHGGEPNQPTAFLHALRDGADTLKTACERKVVDFYGKVPQADDLQRTWIYLLESLREQGQHIELVTTNYDIVLETASFRIPGLTDVLLPACN